jgi:Tfp pilus assembly protein PilF
MNGPAPSDAVTSAEINPLIALINAGRYVELESKVRELLGRHPNSGVMWQLLGLSLTRQDKDALQALNTAVRLLPDDAGAHNNLGNALARHGRLAAAVASFRRALHLRPDFAEAHNNLGRAAFDLGEFDQASASCRRALDLNPRYAEACDNLGSALLALGLIDDALTSFRRALAIDPQFVEAHTNLGAVLLRLGQPDAAAASYRQALQLNPQLAAAHCNLGIAQRLQGRTAEAQASCRNALAIDPQCAAAFAVLAECCADCGEFAQAEGLFRRAISIEAESPEAWAGLARLRKMSHTDAPWLAQVQRIVEKGLPPHREICLRYAIGKYFDDVRDFEQAFVQFRRANELTAQRRAAHDRRQLTQTVDLIARSYDRDWVRRPRTGAVDSNRPVFIVGMLRSGTTLAEQILASHPAVFGAGELTFWNQAAAAYRPGEANLAALGADYSRVLQTLSGDALRVIDKMPTNFAHLGLIHAALPDARIIHMRRNPLDNCLSIYCQHFETTVSYANDLEDLAHYYTEYHRVMEHWRSTLPENVVLDVPYEGLVADQETWSRKMLEFVGIPWDPCCLEFHRTQRTVITASKWQVRQRMSAASVARWRNYEKFLAPLLPLLELERRAAAI